MSRRALALTALLIATAALAAVDPFISAPVLTQGSPPTDSPGWFVTPVSLEAEFTDPALGWGRTAQVNLAVCDGPDGCPPGNACSAYGSWQPADLNLDEGPVRDLSGGHSLYPEAATLRDGSTVVTWQRRSGAPWWDGGAADWDVFAQRLDADGGLIGGEIAVATGSGDDRHPRVAALDGGRFVVAWTRPDGDDSGVYARVFSGANATGPAFAVSQGEGREEAPSVAGSPGGDFAVVWTEGWDPTRGSDWDDAGADLDVQVRWFSRTGAAHGDSRRLHQTSNDHELQPTIAELAGGGWVAGWVAQQGQGSSRAVQALAGRFLRDIDSLDQQFLVANAQLAHARDLRVVGSPDAARFAFLWSARTGGLRRVFARSFDDAVNAQPLGPAFAIDSTSRAQVRPAGAWLDDDHLVVAWAETPPGADLLGRVVDPLGAPLSPTVPLGTDRDSAPALTRTAADGVQLVWHAGSNTDRALRSRSFGPYGTLSTEGLTPHQDIDVQFRWLGEQGDALCSDVLRLDWADPSAPANPQVLHPDGYTSATQATVDLDLVDPRVDQVFTVSLWRQEAPLLDDACGPFGAWTLVGDDYTRQSAAPHATDTVDLTDTTCVSYRWQVLNRAGVVHETPPGGTLHVDRVPPVIDAWSNTVAGDELSTTVASSDQHTAVIEADVEINDGPPQPSDPHGTTTLAPLIDGPNTLRLEVRDRAGNLDEALDFAVADLRTPSVEILSLTDGGTYGDVIPFVWSVVGDVTNLGLVLDTVPGPVVPELSGLAAGPHSLTLQGQAPDGAPVSDTVTFEVVPGLFTAFLTAPTGLVEDDRITADWWSSPDAASALFALDGGPAQASPTFEGLVDGEHVLVLTATAPDGSTATHSLPFSTVNLVPLLVLTSPEPSSVVTSAPVPVTFAVLGDSDGVVEWTAGPHSGQIGELNSGIDLPDGEHTLVLTATHANGNQTSEAVAFTVDTRPLDLELLSPSPGIYPSGDIPLEYAASLPVESLTLLLDGVEVSGLDAVPDGTHALTVTATASGGRQSSVTTTFAVIEFAITSPLPGQQVASPDLPPEAPISYTGGAGCDLVTMQVDDEPERAFPAGPDEVGLVSMAKGLHTVRLTCQVGDQSTSRSVDFEIAELNISADGSSLRYRYDNCSPTWDCDVVPILTVHNTGDFDAPNAFDLAFHHLHPDGTEASPAQRLTVESLPEGESIELEGEAVRASLDDRFALWIDPDGALLGETRDDNYRELRFQAASLHEVTLAFDDSNQFIGGATFLNPAVATVSGPVAAMQVSMGDLTIEDPSPDGATFRALADTGLLSGENDCIHIGILGDNGVELDGQPYCLDVAELPLSLEGSAFPWWEQASGGVVDIEAITPLMLAQMDQAGRAAALADVEQPLLSHIAEDGHVAYTLFAMAGLPQNTSMVPMGAAPLVGGEWQLPTQTGLFSVTIDPTTGTCSAGGTMLVDPTFDDALGDLLAANANGIIDRYIDIPDLDDLLDMVPGSVAHLPFGSHADSFLFAADIDLPFGFGVWALGLGGLFLQAPEWEIDLIQHVEAGFDAAGTCSLGFGSGTPTLDVSLDTVRLWGDVTGDISLSLGAQNAEVASLVFPHWNMIPIPILFGFVHAEAEIHPQELHVPVHAGFEILFGLSPTGDLISASAHASGEASVQHGRAPLYSAGFTAWPIIGFGFGFGLDFQGDWRVDAYARLAAEVTLEDGEMTGNPNSPDDEEEDYWGAYTRFYMQVDTYRRSRICFLIWCHWGSWSHQGTNDSCMPFGDVDWREEGRCRCADEDPYTGEEACEQEAPGGPLDR